MLWADSNVHTLEKMFDEVRNFCLIGDYRLLLKKVQIQRGDSINNLGYKILLPSGVHCN